MNNYHQLKKTGFTLLLRMAMTSCLLILSISVGLISVDSQSTIDDFMHNDGSDKHVLEAIQSFQYHIMDEIRDIKEKMSDMIIHQETHDHRLDGLDQSLYNITSHLKDLTFKQPRDCNDLPNSTNTRRSGVHHVLIGNKQAGNVFCDMTTPGGPWLVFQRRKDGSVDFFRNWKNYTDGFGDLNGEFWLGNENLYLLTSTGRYKLRVDLEDWEGNKRYTEYSSFSVGNGNDYYRLSVSGLSGTAGDSYTDHSGHQFSTRDADHDIKGDQDCATRYRGAWWYHLCHNSNLNGQYFHGPGRTPHGTGVIWQSWRGFSYSLKKTEMKISRVD